MTEPKKEPVAVTPVVEVLPIPVKGELYCGVEHEEVIDFGPMVSDTQMVATKGLYNQRYLVAKNRRAETALKYPELEGTEDDRAKETITNHVVKGDRGNLSCLDFLKTSEDWEAMEAYCKMRKEELSG